MRTFPSQAGLVTRQLLLSRWLTSNSLTGPRSNAAQQLPGAGLVVRCIPGPGDRGSAIEFMHRLAVKQVGQQQTHPTVAGCAAPRHTALLMSVRRRACTACALGKRRIC